MSSYIPRRYPGRITLFRSCDEHAGRPPDPTLGWSRIAAEVDVYTIPGNHVAVVTKNLSILAEHLRTCLCSKNGGQPAIDGDGRAA